MTLAAANALVAAGEPRQALKLVSRSSSTFTVDRGLLVTKALVELGDATGAHAALRSLVADLPHQPRRHPDRVLAAGRPAGRPGGPARTGPGPGGPRAP